MIDENNQVDWNLSAELVRQIGESLAEAGYWFKKGRPDKQFFCLLNVKGRFIQSIKPEEEKVLEKKELEIHRVNRRLEGIQRRNQMGYLVLQYNNEIMKLLQKYGYLVGLKKNKEKIV